MQQIVLKENIPHPNHRQDEGRRGRIPKPSHYVIRRNKIVRKLDKYPSKVRIFFFQKEDKNKRLTTVVMATRSARAIDGGEDGDGT